MNLVAQARDIAEKAHEGQFRRRGLDKRQPYFVHPERIASTFQDEIRKAVGYLHDVPEDTKVTIEDLIALGIPDAVIEALRLLTRKEGVPYITYILGVLQNPIARDVKRADLLDNLEGLEEGNLKEKYLLALHIVDNL